jgi:hypothetical protein
LQASPNGLSASLICILLRGPFGPPELER